jgi:hypothetical protein
MTVEHPEIFEQFLSVIARHASAEATSGRGMSLPTEFTPSTSLRTGLSGREILRPDESGRRMTRDKGPRVTRGEGQAVTKE